VTSDNDETKAVLTPPSASSPTPDIFLMDGPDFAAWADKSAGFRAWIRFLEAGDEHSFAVEPPFHMTRED
jgi:hypothetical protein